MDELQLRQVVTSLCTLAEHGPLPVHAYSVLVKDTCPEALGEELHRGWLTDSRFAPCAAAIIQHCSTAEHRTSALSTCCLAFLLNDFRSRKQLRDECSFMARNALAALFHMYPVYFELDECFSRCFVQPLFVAAQELLEQTTDIEDIRVAACLLCEHGKRLFELRPLLMEKVMLLVRRHLVSDDPNLPTYVRNILLHALDLHTHKWNELRIPDHFITGQLEFTAELHDAAYENKFSMKYIPRPLKESLQTERHVPTPIPLTPELLTISVTTRGEQENDEDSDVYVEKESRV